MWLPQADDGASTDLLSGPEDWPGVEWPSTPIGKNAPQTGTGDWGLFTMGTGGPCTEGLPGTYSPPFGYYCSNHPPRGTQYRHRPPMGINVGSELPNAPYTNASGAVIQSWMPEHWYSNQYLISSQTVHGTGGYGGRGFFDERKLSEKQQAGRVLSQKLHAEEVSTEFSFLSGGYQGNIGTPEAGTSGEWYIEVREKQYSSDLLCSG